MVAARIQDPRDMKRPPRATYRALLRGPGWEGYMVNRPVSLNPNKPWGGVRALPPVESGHFLLEGAET